MQSGSGQEPASASGAASVTNGAAETYTFSDYMNPAVIVCENDYSGYLKVKVNPSSDASTTSWQYSLAGGDHLETPHNYNVLTVSIYADGANATFKSDFQVNGYQADR